MPKNVTVLSGDISAVKADGLITAINSGGMWFGGIDGVIMKSVGGQFHEQAKGAMPLKDGQVVVARGGSGTVRAAFQNVIFVVDDLKQPLHNIVLAGLRAAEANGMKSVTLPTIRMGVMLGVVEKSVTEAIAEMSLGIDKFLGEYPESALRITFVVYNDAPTQRLLEDAMSGKLPA